ncbi:MAG: helix-turn-helix domain-containing protein [Haloarculaceae archaeon]
MPDGADDHRSDPPVGREGNGTAPNPVVAEYQVPASAFVLGEVLTARPASFSVDFEQIVPTQESPLAYLWTGPENADGFESAAAADSTVRELARLASLDDGSLYRIDWMTNVNPLLDRLAFDDVTLVTATATDDEWFLRLRFSSRRDAGAFQTFLYRRDVDHRLISVHDLEEPKIAQYGVTKKQRAALVTAFELGYFDVHRTATLQDVAAALDISDKAASERLRRRQSTLIGGTLTIGSSAGVGTQST